MITKLTAPVYPRRLVRRTRLTDRMQEGTGTKLTLVVAPAGFGKTTLLREWTATLEGGDWPAAWILLDKDDDGPRIWAYLLEALRTVDPGQAFDWQVVAKAAPHKLGHGQIGHLINQIATIPRSFSVILDDYHEVRDNDFHGSLAYLIDHMPSNMHMVISSRTSLPMPLARLRSQRQVTEIVATDLSFTRQEAETFLDEVMELPLADEDVLTLLEKTEGWIAGLQMAVLSLKGGRTASSILQEFSGDSREVFSYLTEEVVDQQSEEVRDFLIRTSLLSTMTASLCDHVLGSHDSRARLSYLEQANLFIVPLDERRHWYRYHSLFADYLRSRLEAEHADEIGPLHLAACSWLEAHGRYEQAVPHAFAGADYERAAADIEAYVEKSVLSSDLLMVLQWIERLPRDSMLKRPRLAMFVTMARMAVAERAAFRRAVVELGDIVDEASDAGTRASESPGVDTDTTIVRTTAACIRGDYQRAIDLYEHMTPVPENTHFLMLGLLLYHMHLAFLACGRFDEAVGVISAARRLADEHGLDDEYISTLCTIGRLERSRGRLHDAAAAYGDALEYTRKHALSLGIVSLVQAGLSDIFREWGRLERADELIQTAKQRSHEPARYLEWNISPDHLLVMVRHCLAHSDYAAARRYLDEVEFALPKYYKVPFLAAQARSLEVRYWLATGNLQRAAEWLDETEAGLAEPGRHTSAVERLAMARAALALGRARQALDYLPPVQPDAPGFPLYESRIEHDVLRALALEREGDRAAARASLVAALRLGEPEGFMHVFAGEGPALAPLLGSVLHDFEQGAVREVPVAMVEYTRSLWKYCSAMWERQPAPDAAQAPGRVLLSEPLSARELEILKLMAAGSSPQAISERLFISVNTTRTHIRNVYQKLGVHTRQEAVERAIMAAII